MKHEPYVGSCLLNVRVSNTSRLKSKKKTSEHVYVQTGKCLRILVTKVTARYTFCGCTRQEERIIDPLFIGSATKSSMYHSNRSDFHLFGFLSGLLLQSIEDYSSLRLNQITSDLVLALPHTSRLCISYSELLVVIFYCD